MRNSSLNYSNVASSSSVKYKTSELPEYTTHQCSVEVPENRQTMAFLSLVESYDLTQNITEATHQGGYTLDIVLTKTFDIIVWNIAAQLGVWSRVPTMKSLAWLLWTARVRISVRTLAFFSVIINDNRAGRPSSRSNMDMAWFERKDCKKKGYYGSIQSNRTQFRK